MSSKQIVLSLFMIIFFMNDAIKADQKTDFLLSLYDCGAVLEGEFPWHTISSPVHVDMKTIISQPPLFSQAIQLASNVIVDQSFDALCAVPWGPVPLAGALAARLSKPMIMVRKEVASGTMQKQIEGQYTEGQKVLLIEDSAGTGMSMQETVTILERAGLIVTDIVVLFDFEHGALEKFARQGKRVHAIATICDLLEVLKTHRNVSASFLQKVQKYCEATRYCFR